ncbi:MAG: GDSL family lipase [Nitrospirae bacterium]|nr:GDSL family lipase [Nitrospirota bacterium]NTW68067.1 GDSL family lipase [Nitrospirota bacterium]
MKKNLVFIGDSLTEWYDWQERFPDCRVLNLGISGETVEELLDRRDHIRSRIESPDIIFLMTGINNILSERYEITGPYAEVVRNLATWYKGAKVVVQSLLPVDMPWIKNDTIRTINRHLAAIAREHTVEYLDVYSSFVDENGSPKPGLLSDDGVHLASKGYEVWAKVVEEYLNR